MTKPRPITYRDLSVLSYVLVIVFILGSAAAYWDHRTMDEFYCWQSSIDDDIYCEGRGWYNKD